jgi:hypothetical protein
VQRGLVGNRTSQERVAVAYFGVQGGECAPHRLAEVAADADLVGGRRLPVALLAGHRLVLTSEGKAVAILAMQNRHRTARSSEKASTAGKVPVNPDSTPTPTTGMIRPA